jgi:hypothetical protein
LPLSVPRTDIVSNYLNGDVAMKTVHNEGDDRSPLPAQLAEAGIKLKNRPPPVLEREFHNHGHTTLIRRGGTVGPTIGFAQNSKTSEVNSKP